VSRLQSDGGASVRDINDRGVAVGVQVRQNPDGTLRGVPVRWRGTAAQVIPQPADRSLAGAAINDRGDILLGSVAGLDGGPPLLRSADGTLTPIESRAAPRCYRRACRSWPALSPTTAACSR
jgi:hypothetical protein